MGIPLIMPLEKTSYVASLALHISHSMTCRFFTLSAMGSMLTTCGLECPIPISKEGWTVVIL